MKRLAIDGKQSCRIRLDAATGHGMKIENLRVLASGSPFDGMYEPDDSKAFMEFEICNSFPSFLGPVAMGADVANYCCFFPDTLAASHGVLQFQQLNIGHLLSAYGDPPDQKDGKEIRNDRIIGAIVATSFPEKPLQGGWRLPGNSQGATGKITCCAVVFKMAKGVSKLLGGHLSNRDPQSVSIEVHTSMDNLGVYVPSQDNLIPLLEPTEDVFSAYKIVKGVNMPRIGKLKTDAYPDGEQLLVSYGMNGRPVHFAGVGVTPTPAEKNAKILRITAQGSNVVGIAASSVFGALKGQKVTFFSGRPGIIRSVDTSGNIRHSSGGFSRTATEHDPVLTLQLPDGNTVLRHFSELQDRLEE